MKNAALTVAGLVIPLPLAGSERRQPLAMPERVGPPSVSPDTDEARLSAWTTTLRRESPVLRAAPFGRRAARVGALAVGTPYEPFTLEAYIKAGGDPSSIEPLTLSLTRFDCVTLVESCLAVARAAGDARAPSWQRFGQEIERMRYRGGKRQGYPSRLHYFSEWITDGERRGLVHDLGAELGGVNDARCATASLHDRASQQLSGARG